MYLLQLEDYMLPCIWKQSFGVDCMGCGMQRSLILVLQGEFTAAFYMYPAIYSLIFMFGFLVLHLKFKFTKGHKILLGLFILNISIIAVNFLIKTF